MLDSSPERIPAVARGSNVVLIGLMGSGKSSVGRQVAENLHFTFVDTDERIVAAAGCRIPEIFAREGEEGFRLRETSALQSLLGAQNHLVSTGGGIVLREENRGILRSLGFIIWLTASLDTLAFRIAQNRERPLMRCDNPREKLAELMAAREPLYQELADFTVDTTDLTVAETVHGLVESIHYHFAVRS